MHQRSLYPPSYFFRDFVLLFAINQIFSDLGFESDTLLIHRRLRQLGLHQHKKMLRFGDFLRLYDSVTEGR